MPRFRLGHGLYTEDLDTEEGKKLIEEMKETGAVLEFQLTSNVRLNNLSKLEKHPLKRYLEKLKMKLLNIKRNILKKKAKSLKNF